MSKKQNSQRIKERRTRIAMIDDPAESRLSTTQLLIAFAILLIIVSFGVRLFFG